MLVRVIRETRDGTLDEGPFEEGPGTEYYEKLVVWVQNEKDHHTMMVSLVSADRTKVLQQKQFPYTPYYVPTEAEMRKLRRGTRAES